MNHKFYNQIRIHAGSPTDGIRLTKGMSQMQMCKKFSENILNIYYCRGLSCDHCMFYYKNKHHWKIWKKEVFKGVKK